MTNEVDTQRNFDLKEYRRMRASGIKVRQAANASIKHENRPPRVYPHLPKSELDVFESMTLEGNEVINLSQWCDKTGVPIDMITVRVSLDQDTEADTLTDMLEMMGCCLDKDKRRSVQVTDMPTRPHPWAIAVDVGGRESVSYRWLYAKEDIYQGPKGTSRGIAHAEKHAFLLQLTKSAEKLINAYTREMFISYVVKVLIEFKGVTRARAYLGGMLHDMSTPDIDPTTGRTRYPGYWLDEVDIEPGLNDLLSWLDANSDQCIERAVVKNQIPLPFHTQEQS